jgi:RimJ/RimL family protein N-acetyltransferase
MTARTNAYGQPIGPPVEMWRERRHPSRTAIDGRYCRIEPVDLERHALALFEAYMQAPDDRDWTYLFSERPASIGLFRQHLANLAVSNDPLHYAIVERASDTAVGTASLMRIEPLHGVIEVGNIGYSPLLKRTPAGTEAMYLLMRRVFDELHYRRYEWKCDSLNAPSCAAAKRYGFRFEGVFRKAVVYKNRSRDTAWFSIIDDEWPRIRETFQTWLDPQNFDAAGRQQRALGSIRDSI